MTTHGAIVRDEYAGMRLDTFLAQRYLNSGDGLALMERPTQGKDTIHSDLVPYEAAPLVDLSRSAVQKLIAGGQVTINGHRTKASARLKLGDHVEIHWIPPIPSKVGPEPLDFPILHEDEDLIVVNKPPGMVVHPAAGNPQGTLVNALLHHCPNLPGIGGERRPGIVHRLDKETSGVMVVAKHERSFRHISLQFKDRQVTKEYAAFVWGRVVQKKVVIDRPIGRHRSDRKRMSSLHSLPRTRSAVTEWEVENSFGLPSSRGPLIWVTWLLVRPHTGRTHQIRVHLADQGFPVLSDKVYGRNNQGALKGDDTAISRIAKFPRQALHAERLSLIHPRTERPQVFTAPWFADMKDLCELLKQCCAKKTTEKYYRG